MPVMNCEVCGNAYDRAFQVVSAGATHVFDSFECAIEAMAPRCAQCGCRVIGHGIEAGARTYCGAHCAHRAGFGQATDRVEREEIPAIPP